MDSSKRTSETMSDNKDPIVEPDLPLEEREARAIRLYLDLYRKGKFYECHDVMEEIWFETDREKKRFFQGLLQCAVCRHHWGNGNRRGAAILYREGVEKLASYRPVFLGVDLDAFISELSQALPDDLARS